MLPLPRGAVWQALFLLCAVLFLREVRSEGRVVCYYTNWSVYRPGTAKFNPQNINPYLCTHLVYAFGGFTKDNQMKPFDKYQDIEQGGYAKFTGLKTYNKQLKTMIAIGGWNEASSRFSPLVANPERRQQFIKNILKFLRQNHFDGIDLDWEYPAHRQGGKPRDRDNYAQFVEELRAEFERESEKTGRPRLLLTMAVPAGIEYIDKGYDIPKLNKYLDWFNLLTYDFHSSHEPSANHHAPLYSLEEESEYNYDTELNIDYSVKYYLKAGADRDKLVLGIPTYGRSFTLINEESTEIGAPSEGPGEQGDATREKGYLAYYEICQNLKEDPEWTVVQPNPNAMGPYAYRRNQWVGYDDEEIVRKKAQYAVEHGLGGIMFWAIDNDDFRGTCTGKPYPLIEAAKEAMLDSLGLGINEVAKPSGAPKKPLRSRSRENISRNRINSAGEKSTFNDRKENARRTTTAPRKTTTTTTEAPRTTTIKLTEAEGSSLYIGGRTTTPPPPTTPDPGTDFKCEEEGFFQHPRDCKKYYWCLDSGPSGLGIVAHQFTCPSGLYFNPAADSCDFARNVPCKTKKSTTAAPVTTTTTTTTTPRPTSSYNRITAATSRNSFLRTTTKRTTTTTTTTTAAPPVEEEIEYEDEDEEQKNSNSNKDRDPEEDPKVIQELIDLIRKLGGIEELEKYLSRKEDGSIALKEQTSSNSAAKSSGIAKTVYEKVVSRPNTYNSFRNRLQSSTLYKKTGLVETSSSPSNFDAEDEEESGGLTSSSNSGSSYSKYSSVVRGNSRQGPQNEGLEKLPEFDAFIKEKKQYVTINRNRGSFKAQQGAEEVANEDDVDDEDEILDEEIVNTSRKSSGNGVTYSTIRRTKTKTVKTTTEEDIKRQEEERLRIEQENNEKKIYATLNRTRGRYPTTEQPPTVASDEIISTTNRYKYFERTRPTKSTTTITITDADELEANVNDDEDDQEDDAEKEQENVMVHILSQSEESTQKPSQTTRLYASIGRKTKTTTATKTTIAPTESTFVTNQSEKTTEPTPEPISTTATPITASSTTTTATATNQPEIITTTNHPIASSSNHILSNSATSSLNDVDSSALFDTTTSTNVPNIILSSSDSKESSHQNTIDKNTNLAHDTQSTAVTGVETTSSNQDESENSAKIKTTTRTTTKTLTTTGTTDADDDQSSVDNDEKVTNLSKNITRTQYKYIRTRVPTNKTITTTTNDQNESTTNTRTRTTTTTTTTTNNQSIQNNLNSDNGKGVNNISVKYSGGGRRQQANVKSPLQTQQTAPTTTATTPTTEPTSSFKPFLGTVSSPRPFGFPIRRTRPSSTTTTTETNNILLTVEQLSDADEASSSIKSSSEQTKKKYQSNRSRTASAARTRTSSRFSTAQQQQSSNQNEVRETTSLPNNSKDQVNELNEDTRSTVGSSTTTESTTRISSRPSVRPTSRRIRVLKYRRPVGSNNVTLVDSKQINDTNSSTSSVTNSIDTSLDLSVNEPSSVVSNYENTNSENTQTQNSETTQTQTAAQSHRTQTTNTSKTPANQNVTPTKRFRKVVRKLIRPVQKSTTEGVVLEVESSTVATIETTTATSIPASASTRRSGSRFNLKNYLAEKAGTPIDEENKKIVAPTTTSRSRNGYSRRKNLNFNKAEANNDEETNEQNIITTSPRGRTRFSIASLSSTTTEQIPKAFTRAPLFGGRSRFTGYTVATSTTEASDIEEEFDDSLAAVLTEADVNEDAQYEDTIASTTERAIIQQEIWESKTVVADEVNGQSKRPGIPLTTPIIVASIEEENDELTTDDETLDDVEETTGEAVGIISSSVVTENALEIESKLNEETNNNATSTVLSEDTQAITEKTKIEENAQTELVGEEQVKEEDINEETTEVRDDELKTDIKEVISEESLSTSLQQSSGETKGLNASQLEEVVEEPIKNVRLPKLLRENALTISTSNTVDESGESNESQTAVNDENETTSATSTRKPFIPASKLKALQAESKTTSSDDVSNETTTPASIVRPTFRRKLISKRPYSPTRPSFLPISTTKQPSSFQPKRIFGRRKYGQFGKTNGDEEDDESIRTKTTLITSRVPAYKRFRPQNNQRNEFNEEEEQPVKAVIARPPGLFSRQKILTATTEEELTDENENEEEEQIDDEENEEEGDDNDDEEEEDEDNNDVVAEIDEDEDEENIQITTELPALDLETTDASTTEAPTKHIVNVPFNPNYRKPPSFKNRPGSQSNRFGSTDLNSSGRPTNRPHIINQPHGAYETTPTALQIEEEAVDDEETTVTPDDEDIINTKVTKSRTYERKFGIQSTTELSSGSGENAVKTIEDLDIEALNARNKKIFESHSKKHTTPKIFTTTTTTSTTTTEQELQEQEQEQQPPPQEAPQFTKQNTETENDDAYDSSYSDGHQNGFITTTPATPTSHNIEHNTIIRTKTNSNQISSQDNEGWTTSTPPTTTLLHVFTLTDEDEQTSQPPTESEHQGAILLPERGEPKHKVIEINRIVEITSKEEKLRRKSKGNNDFTKVAPATLKVESFPHLEPLGEISVVKYVHLVNGDDILVDGHSSVADYTPTDASFTSNSIPVRNSLPDGSSSHDYAQLNSASANTHEIATVRSRLEERYGKALVPEVIREAVETSTISLEGLFDSSRKGKKLDSGEDTFNELSIETKKNKQDLDVRTTIIEAQTGVPSSISVVRELLPETTTLASIIDSAITSGEASVYVENNVISTNTESTTIESILSDSITPPVTSIETTTAEPTSTESSTTESTSTTQSTTTESTLSTVAATESNIFSETPTTTESVTYVKATPVPVALFPTYVRPIVPLLRPESNESSPLVISIANLDKVILSKVMKTDTESTPSPTVATTTTSTTEFTPVSDSSAEFSNHNAAILEIPTNSQKTHTDSHTDSSGVTIVLAKTLGDSPVGSSVVDVSNASGLSQNNLNTNTVKIVNENEVEVNSQSSVSDSSNDSKSVKEVVSFSSETHVVHRKKKGRKRKGKKSHKLRTTTPRPIETTTINEVDDRAIVITPVKEIYNRAIEMTPVKEVDDRAIEMTPVKEVDDSAIETTTIKEVDDSAIKTTDIKGVDDSAIETTTIKEVDDRAIEMTDINEVDDSAFETTTLSEASDLAIETATVYEANDSAIEMTTLTSEADDVETSTKAQV